MNQYTGARPFFDNTRRVGECLEWTAAIDRGTGYGRRQHNGKPMLAHRVAWMIVNGEIPDGAQVLHRCDNPKCVDVNHLFIGSQSDNIKDMHSKGRASGMQRGHSNAHLPRNNSGRWIST